MQRNRPDCSPFFWPFIFKLSAEDQEFVAAYKLFKEGWRERVPPEKISRAVDIQKGPYAYRESLIALCREHQLASPSKPCRRNQDERE